MRSTATNLVVSCEHEVEEGYDCALEFDSTRAGEGVGGESLPDDGLADVGGDEERDARAQAIAVLQHFVQANNNDAGKQQLHPQQEHSAQAQYCCRCKSIYP